MTKLNQAKENLSAALAYLEKVIFDKLNQNISGATDPASKGVEAENNKLKIRNEELEKSKTEKQQIINQIKIDLAQIKKIINHN